MRILLALALVLHIAGMPVMAAMPCPGGNPGNSSCCEPAPAAAPSVEADCCGCHEMESEPTPDHQPDPATTVSTVQGHDALPVLIAFSPLYAASPEASRGDHLSSQPVQHDSFLAGGGFRC